ncbi:hypothetical protein N2152v2_007091 [Parachlorella kessleri]
MENGKKARCILIAVDNYDSSEKSLEWALQNLYKGGDDLRLVHVVPVVGDPSPVVVDMALPFPLGPSPSTQDLKRVEEAKDFIKERFDKILTPREIPYTVEIVHFMVSTDNIGEIICKRADSLKAHAVVLAKHQRGLLHELFLGSVAKYVCGHCKQPVVVLHA